MMVYQEPTTEEPITESPTTKQLTTTVSYEYTTYLENEQAEFDEAWQDNVAEPDYGELMGQNNQHEGYDDIFEDGIEDQDADTLKENEVLPYYDNETDMLNEVVTEGPEITRIPEAQREDTYVYEEGDQNVQDTGIREEEQLIDIWDKEDNILEDEEFNPWDGMDIEDNTNENQKPKHSVDDNAGWMKMFKSNIRSSLASGRLIALIIIVSVIVVVSSVVLISYKCSVSRDKMNYRRLDRDGDKDAIRPLYSAQPDV